jgi:hypothetical protein
MQIPLPKALDDSARKLLLASLGEAGYNERNCAERFGAPHLGKANLMGRPKRPSPDAGEDGLETLIGFFQFGRPTPMERLNGLLSKDVVRILGEIGFFQEAEGAGKPLMHIVPCRSLMIATDLKMKNEDINRVMFLWRDSMNLAYSVMRPRRKASLDLGTGSGVHALLAALHSERAMGVDNNPRAIDFSKFNQWLNGIPNAEFLVGDLYEPARGRKFDWILANPPYIPSKSEAGGADYQSGGASGEELLSRVLGGLDEFLTPEGFAQIITLMGHQKNIGYAEKIDRWMGGKLKSFDVLICATDAPDFFNLLDEAHRAEFSKFEFGVINVRRAKRPREGSFRVDSRGIGPYMADPSGVGTLGEPAFDSA